MSTSFGLGYSCWMVWMVSSVIQCCYNVLQFFLNFREIESIYGSSEWVKNISKTECLWGKVEVFKSWMSGSCAILANAIDMRGNNLLWVYYGVFNPPFFSNSLFEKLALHCENLTKQSVPNKFRMSYCIFKAHFHLIVFFGLRRTFYNPKLLSQNFKEHFFVLE